MDGLKQTNWMQDTILEEMQVGRTGNEVLASFDARMKAEGIDGKMYSHAIGDHGHAAGPTVGLAEMNNQPVPVKVRAVPSPPLQSGGGGGGNPSSPSSGGSGGSGSIGRCLLIMG
jgi:hypothetical protein